MFPYLVSYGGVPGVASAKFARLLRLYPVTATKGGLLLVEGAKSTSHLKPYVIVSRGIIRQLSCAKAPRLFSTTVAGAPDLSKLKKGLPFWADAMLRKV